MAKSTNVPTIKRIPDNEYVIDSAGKMLRTLRELAGYSMSEIAEYLGIPMSQLSDMELGRTPITLASLKHPNGHSRLSLSK